MTRYKYPSPRNTKPKPAPEKLPQVQLDLLLLVNAANPVGIEIDALILRCAKMGERLNQDVLRDSIKQLIRAQLVSLDDNNRVFITSKGASVLA